MYKKEASKTVQIILPRDKRRQGAEMKPEDNIPQF